MPQHMRETQCLDVLHGKLAVLHLDLLQADDIRLFLLHETAQQIEPQAERIDVPGCKTHGIPRQSFDEWMGEMM